MCGLGLWRHFCARESWVAGAGAWHTGEVCHVPGCAGRHGLHWPPHGSVWVRPPDSLHHIWRGTSGLESVWGLGHVGLDATDRQLAGNDPTRDSTLHPPLDSQQTGFPPRSGSQRSYMDFLNLKHGPHN